MGEIISAIIGISYFVLGYWSVGETIYANKVIIGRIGDMWIQRFLIGAMFGWILIPVALIKRWLFQVISLDNGRNHQWQRKRKKRKDSWNLFMTAT